MRTNIEIFYWEMEFEKLPNVFLSNPHYSPPPPATSTPPSSPPGKWHRSCGLGELHWLETRRADCMIWEGLKLALKSLQGKVLEDRYHIGLSHRASSESHRKGSIIMQSLCARTGQFESCLNSCWPLWDLWVNYCLTGRSWLIRLPHIATISLYFHSQDCLIDINGLY